MAVAGYSYTELPRTEQAALPGEKELLEVVTHALEAANVSGKRVPVHIKRRSSRSG